MPAVAVAPRLEPGSYISGARLDEGTQDDGVRRLEGGRLRDNDHVGIDFALRLSAPFEFSMVIDLLASCPRPAPEPMRLRPSHIKDAFLTATRIALCQTL